MTDLKNIINKIPYVKVLIIWFLKKLLSSKTSPSYWIDRIAKNDNLNVIQIGANDGKMSDPLYKLIRKNYNWNVLFVEPVPHLFKRLKNNYDSNPRFQFENVAINDGSKQIFYWVNNSANKSLKNLPHWYEGLGSFYKSNIVKQLNGKLEPYIVESEIQGITLPDLIKKNNIQRLDILHIDIEGYDWKVLSQLNLKTFSPLVILFEHKHLKDYERTEARQFLIEKYYIFRFNEDFLCLRRTQNNLKTKDLILLTLGFSNQSPKIK